MKLYSNKRIQIQNLKIKEKYKFMIVYSLVMDYILEGIPEGNYPIYRGEEYIGVFVVRRYTVYGYLVDGRVVPLYAVLEKVRNGEWTIHSLPKNKIIPVV